MHRVKGNYKVIQSLAPLSFSFPIYKVVDNKTYFAGLCETLMKKTYNSVQIWLQQVKT